MKKEIIIKAITEMNTNLLDVVLDNNRAYMDVPKDLFLEKLKNEFKNLKKQGITKFEKVSKGTCNECYKGCSGYTFLTKNNDYLDLLFKEENNEIVDLFRCSDFKNEENLIKKNCIYFRFKKDESKNYNPSSYISSLQEQVENAVKKFEKFENKITDIEEFVFWFKDNKKLHNSVKNLHWEYNFVWHFLSIYIAIENFNNLIINHNFAEKALSEFDNSTEKSIIEWLIKYKDNNLQYLSGYEKTKNWERTNLILFIKSEIFIEQGKEIKSHNNILVDVKKYKKAIEFYDLFREYYWKYIEIYAPTKELFEIYGSFEFELSEYLSVRNLYPDILKKYNIKPKEKLLPTKNIVHLANSAKNQDDSNK